MVGSLTHLSRRFFDVLFSRALSDTERRTVETWAGEDLSRVFFAQPSYDQRHGFEAASLIISSGVEDPDVIVAALMHDIGKRHSGLGIIGRTLTSLAIKTHLPLSERMTAYRDHGLIAARELSQIGAPPLVIDFALHHHDDRPSSIGAEIWEVLRAADQPSKTSGRSGARITSEEK